MSGPSVQFDPAKFAQGRNDMAQLRVTVASSMETLRSKAAGTMASIRRRGDQLRQQLDDAIYQVNALDDEDDGRYEYEQLEQAQRAMREFRQLNDQAQATMRRLNGEIERFAGKAGGRIMAAVAEADRALAEAGVYMSIGINDAPSGRAARSIKRSGNGGGIASSGGISQTAALEALRAASSSEGLPDGYYWLELDKLPESCFVSDPALFRKYPKERMAIGIRTLFEHVLPEIARNPNVSKVAFEQMDARQGTGFLNTGEVRPDSRAAVYDVFLSKRSSAEVVIVGNVLADGTPDITSGRHRLGVARELGYTRLPVRIGTGPA